MRIHYTQVLRISFSLALHVRKQTRFV